MSKTPPTLTELITPDLKTRMIKSILKQIKKFPRRNVAEDLPTYMERKMYLPAGTSARPGPYRFANAPMWREVAYEMSESTKTTEGAVMAATQTGKTVVMMGHEQYCVEYGIGPVCYVSSDEGLALKHSETRFGPMLQAAGMMDYISAPVTTTANKGTGNKLNLKFFKGTFIQFIGARSESKASSTPIRILHIDEEDKFLNQLVGGGDPTLKLLRRTDSYDKLKKVWHVSTPKRKATSRIEPLFNQGDMRYYNVECQNPECGELHKLEWKNIKWDKDENGRCLLKYDDDDNLINDPVWHICPHCGYEMKCHEKVQAMKEEGHGGHAKWIPTKKPDRPGIKSWHVSGLYGFRSWLDIILQFQDAKDDNILLEDFICDTLAETWSEEIDKPSEHYLAARAEQDWTRGIVHEKVKALTSGWDIQKDRVEGAVIGWNVRKESWAIDYHIFPGTPSDPYDKCWDKMEEVIMKDYFKTDGTKINIQVVLVDARYETESVKNFCERFPYSPNSWKGVFPAYGKKHQSDIIKQHPGTIATPEIFMDDQRLKREIYMHLRKKQPASGHNVPNGYMHFPADYSEEYYKQMVAEDITEITDSKGMQTEIIIHNPHQRRNEVLDTTKMALGGFYYMYLTFFKLWNNKRKAMRKKEIAPDWQLFWAKLGYDANEQSIMEDVE